MQIAYAPDYWQDGAFLSGGHPAARDGYALADGVFETVAFRQNRLERWDAHLARLREATAFFGLDVAYTDAELTAFAKTLLGAAGSDVGYRLRVTVARRGAGATVTMAYAPISPRAPVVAFVPSAVIRPAGNPSTRYKTLGYTDAVIAQRACRPGEVALLRNQWGRLACASYANVYGLVDGAWVTPAVSEGALPGIVRAELLESGAPDGRRVVAGRLEAAAATSFALSNSIVGWRDGIGLLAGRERGA